MSVKKLLFKISLAVLLISMGGCSSKHQQTWSTSGGSHYTPNKSSSNTKSYASAPKRSGKKRSSKAIHRATMRPYEVHGKKYYPSVVEVGEEFSGISSWYGPNFHGKKNQ